MDEAAKNRFIVELVMHIINCTAIFNDFAAISVGLVQNNQERSRKAMVQILDKLGPLNEAAAALAGKAQLFME